MSGLSIQEFNNTMGSKQVTPPKRSMEELQKYLEPLHYTAEFFVENRYQDTLKLQKIWGATCYIPLDEKDRRLKTDEFIKLIQYYLEKMNSLNP